MSTYLEQFVKVVVLFSDGGKRSLLVYAPSGDPNHVAVTATVSGALFRGVFGE